VRQPERAFINVLQFGVSPPVTPQLRSVQTDRSTGVRHCLKSVASAVSLACTGITWMGSVLRYWDSIAYQPTHSRSRLALFRSATARTQTDSNESPCRGAKQGHASTCYLL
jgi:hypothetical protein